MNVSQDNNDRLVRLEINAEHQAEKLEAMAEKVNEMHAVFMQAKGARWMFLAIGVMVGSIMVNVKTILSLLGVKFGS
jgi:hypothetical protein